MLFGKKIPLKMLFGEKDPYKKCYLGKKIPLKAIWEKKHLKRLLGKKFLN